MSSVGRVSSLEGVHDVGALLGELVAHLGGGKPPLVQPVVVPARGRIRQNTSQVISG